MFRLKVPESNLQNLKTYKCSGEDKSITRTYILNPYVYEVLIHFIPQWLAPNVVTLLGFVMIMLNAMVCMYYSPDFYNKNVPRWVFFFNAFCLFAYQTLDNLDGKQARRTNQSSALGEMFDHGCDAISCTFGAFNWALLCAKGPSLFTFSILLNSWLPFAFATWEEYYVGGLYLGYLNGPIEGLLCMQLSHLAAGIFGQHFWHMTLKMIFTPLTPFVPEFIADCELCVLVTSAVIIIAILNSLINVYNVYNQVQKNCQEMAQFGNKIKPEDLVWKETSFIRALIHLLPFITLMGGAYFWLYISPSKIFAKCPYLFLSALGLSFGYLASNITLAYLLKARLKRFSLTVCIPILLCLINVILGRYFEKKDGLFLSEVHSLYIYFCIAFMVYINFVLTVCLHMSNYLKIGILRILPKNS